MDHRSNTWKFSASIALFEMATECIRLRSNELGRLETLDGLITGLLSPPVPALQDIESLQDHLLSLPPAGDVLLKVRLQPEIGEAFADMREELSVSMETPLTEVDTISVLLFAYMVERKVRAALDVLEHSSADHTHSIAARSCPNVVPIRR